MGLYSRSRLKGAMRRLIASLLVLVLLGALPAHAVVKGSASAIGRYVVRLVGDGHCSGVVIARDIVATAGHCAKGMRVIAAGRSFRVTRISRSAMLDDGRRLTVSGDAVILRLATPLPAEVEIAPLGYGEGDSYTILGYGTTDERRSGPSRLLQGATLVAQGPVTLVDPNRTDQIGASACFGDSGGAVLRGGMLVGIITRAIHPASSRACGFLTRWEPLTLSAPTVASAEPIVSERAVAEEPRDNQRQISAPRPRTRQSFRGAFNVLGRQRPATGVRDHP